MLDERMTDPHKFDKCGASALDVALERFHYDYKLQTSAVTNSVIRHRETMNRHFTSMYTTELIEESRLDANMIWMRAQKGEVSVDDILSSASALPAELRTDKRVA